MSEYYITFQSLTAAQRAAIALTKEGIAAQLIRTPKQLSTYGCSYAIRIPYKAKRITALVFYQNQIPWERIFSVTGDRIVEEVLF